VDQDVHKDFEIFMTGKFQEIEPTVWTINKG
jgi:hypothetical protein